MLLPVGTTIPDSASTLRSVVVIFAEAEVDVRVDVVIVEVKVTGMWEGVEEEGGVEEEAEGGVVVVVVVVAVIRVCGRPLPTLWGELKEQLEVLLLLLPLLLEEELLSPEAPPARPHIRPQNPCGNIFKI